MSVTAAASHGIFSNRQQPATEYLAGSKGKTQNAEYTLIVWVVPNAQLALALAAAITGTI